MNLPQKPAKILITRPWPQDAQAYLTQRYEVTVHDAGPLSPEQLRAAMTQYDAICSTVTDRLTAEVFAVPDARVKMVANFGVGYEHIDTAAAAKAGIAVSNTPDVLTQATADIALMLMLMASRRAGEGERQVRSGGWKGWGATALMGQSLQGKTLGLVGFGRIGQATAHKTRTALDMKIAYFSRSRASAEVEAAHQARYVGSLEELAAQADVLSLHMPGGDDTRHMIDARVLGCMKPSAILINTARGSVVNEADLAKALSDGTLWAAGLDVYEREPEVHPDLLLLDNVVLLPHLGSATVETREAMGMRAARNVDQFFAGEPVGDRIA